MINNSCFNGKGTLGSLDSNNKKAMDVKDEVCLKVDKMSIGCN